MLRKQDDAKLNIALLMAILSEIDKPIKGVNTINALVYLASINEVPINYTFDILKDGTVISEDFFSDLMGIIDQGLIVQLFEEIGDDEVIPVFSSTLSSKQAIEFLKTTAKEDTISKTKAFASRIKRDITDKALRKQVISSGE